MTTKLRESLISFILLGLAILIFIFIFSAFLHPWLSERVYPVNGDEVSWSQALKSFQEKSIIILILLHLGWYFKVFTAKVDATIIRKQWYIWLAIFSAIGAILPTVFTILNPVESETIIIYLAIFLYFLISYVGTFLMSTLWNYSEIRYSSGVWNIIS